MADMTEEDKKLLQNYLLSKINGPEVPEPTFGADNFGVAPSSSTVRQDGIPGGAPAAVLTPPARPIPAPAIASIPASPDEEANDVGGDLPAAPPVPAMPAKAPLSTPMAATPVPDAESILKGSGASDREALYDRLKKNSMSDSVKQTVAGLGDVIMNSYGGKSGEDAQGQLITRKDKLRKEGLENFDKTREDKIQDYMVGRQLIENQRGDKAYNITQEQLQSARDPMSAVSIGARRAAELLDPQGAAAGAYKGKSAFDLNPALAGLEKAGAVEATRNHFKMEESNHADALEQALRAEMDKTVAARSGDIGLQNTKVSQAIHLRQMLNQGYDPKTDTYHLPEMQTGELAMGLASLVSGSSVANMEQLKSVTPKTARGDMAHIVAYWSGTTPNAQPQDQIKNLAHAIDRQGTTSEDLRNHYFEQFRSSANPKIPKAVIDRVINSGRGASFREHMDPRTAPGASFDTGGAGSGAPDHNAALEWANANPNDPRAEEIKRRAGQAAGAQ